MSKKPTEYIVKLTDEQNSKLLSILNKGESNARVIKRANILLQSAQGKTALEITKNLNTSQQTVYNIRKHFVLEGFDDALYDKPRLGIRKQLWFDQEAYLIALACSDPPDGRERWTIRLLTDKIVELGIADEVSRETVRRILKKTNSNHGKRNNGVFLG